jgi:hypothetical protein
MYSHKCPGPVGGDLRVDGQRYQLIPDRDLAILDEHKAYYPYQTAWTWATAAGYDARSRLIGFNLTHNMVQDDETYNENGMWLGNEFHPLSAVRFSFKPDQLLEPWTMETTDGRCALKFVPHGKRSGLVVVGPILSDYHQVYGTFSGRLEDEHGETHALSDLFGVTEQHAAKF